MADKLLAMPEAIRAFVPDGAVVAMGTGLESQIPFSAGHEIIRQGKKDLTLVGPISDILFDQLIGAGCVKKVVAAWIGNVSEGLGHNYRRAAEKGIPRRIEIGDHSNFTISLSLLAGALGTPYIPTKTLLGTDLLETNPTFKLQENPWDGQPLVLVPAIRPDVAIIHVQRADPAGNAHAWGNLGVSEEAALAADSVVLVAEEVVDRAIIISDPNRVLVPGFKVSAVVHEPFGAHPSPVQGYYDRDHAFYGEYHTETRSLDGFEAWLKRWVLQVANRSEYLERLGSERWMGLRPNAHLYAAPVDYGF